MTMIDIRKRIKQATAFVSEGNTDQAIRTFENIVADHRDFEACYSVLCDLYLKAGRTNFPHEWIKQAVKFDPSFNETFLTLASELQSQGNIQESVRVLTALVDANPDNYRARNMSNAICRIDPTIETACTRTDFPECLLYGEYLPLSLDFAVGNRCNASCIMCDGRERWANVAPKWRTVDEVANLLEGVRYFRSAILGGENCEPFINKDLIEIIRVLKSRRVNVTVISNGSLLSKAVIEGLIDASLNRLIVSVHGARKETAESIMQNVRFEKVISNIMQIKELKAISSCTFPQVDIMFVGMKRNINELGEIVTLAGDIGVKSVFIKSLLQDQTEFLKPRLEGENMMAYPELLRSEYEKAQIVAEKCNVRLSMNDPYSTIITSTRNKCFSKLEPQALDSVAMGKTRYCLFPFEKCHLRIDDTVNLCCSNMGRFVVMGNAAENGLGAVWNSQSYIVLRKAILTGENLPHHCDKCDRAPQIEPFVMQMDIAARQAKVLKNKESQKFLKDNIRLYPRYVRGMKNIGQSLIELDINAIAV